MTGRAPPPFAGDYYPPGIDGDFPPTYQFGGSRVHFSGNGRSLAGPLSPRTRSKLDSDVHQIEQQAYAGVLRAFKVQADALSWEKESLMSELRRELKVSDEEHRVLLNKVHEEEGVHRIRQSKQGGGLQYSLQHDSAVAHNLGPLKRQKKSHSIYVPQVGPQPPVMPLHTVARNKADIIRSVSGNQALPDQFGRMPSDGAVQGMGRRSVRFHAEEYYASPNVIGHFNFSHIDIPNTSNLVKKVERVLSHPDVYGIEKAMKLLIDQEQSLLDAIAKLDEASDGESDDIVLTEDRIGTFIG